MLWGYYFTWCRIHNHYVLSIIKKTNVTVESLVLTVNIAYQPCLIQIFRKEVSIANKTILEKLYSALWTSSKRMFENLYALSHGLLATLFTPSACEKGIQLFLCIIYLSFICIPFPRSKGSSPNFASDIKRV